MPGSLPRPAGPGLAAPFHAPHRSGREYPKSRKIRFIRGIERFVYKLADAAVTTSQSNLDYVAQNYHPRRQLLITNYVETDVFRPLGQAKQRGSICFVGSLYHVKNPVLLLEALKGLPYSIDLIGSGSQTGQLQEMARNNGIMANFLGNIPNHELPEILDRHELFVLPSLWEGMPKTLLEAMACGLPVIGTNVPGIREVIKDGENGILCDADANSLRQAIVRLMEDGGLRKRLGENARKTIEQDYSLDRLLEGELALYAELLA